MLHALWLGEITIRHRQGLARPDSGRTGHPEVITVQKSIVGKLSRREPFSLDV
jgi:hypothetical protein